MISLDRFFSILPWVIYLWSEYQKSSTLLTLNSPEAANKLGFVLAAHFNDEVTGSCSNLRSLQCFAGELSNRLEVVEPFLIEGSILGFSQLTNTTVGDHDKGQVALSDLYDIQEWQLYGRERKYAQLVNWTYFLKYAPRKLILLDRACLENPRSCMSCQNNYYSSNAFLDAAQTFAERNNFTIVRKSCYNWKEVYDLEKFYRLAYGSYKPEESVMLINHFGGIQLNGDQFRIQIKNTKCGRNYVTMPKSPKISEMSSTYLQKYLPQALTSGYISVMIRMQYVAIRMNGKMTTMGSNILPEIQKCLDNTIDVVHKLKEKHNLSDVFLATDMGKYGANYFRTGQTDLGVSNVVLEGVMQKFYSELFNLDIVEANLTARIEDVMYPFYSSGYAALLEQNLAALGKCLVLVGDGQFQKNAVKIHFRKGYKCVVHVPECI